MFIFAFVLIKTLMKNSNISPKIQAVKQLLAICLLTAKHDVMSSPMFGQILESPGPEVIKVFQAQLS